MEQLQPILDAIIYYVPMILSIATECGLFFVIKMLLKRQVQKFDDSTAEVTNTNTKLNKQLEVLIHDNAELRKQNKQLIDKLVQVKNGSELLK